jgi:predicted KAP-like P-loop ATPase
VLKDVFLLNLISYLHVKQHFQERSLSNFISKFLPYVGEVLNFYEYLVTDFEWKRLLRRCGLK